MLFGNGPHQALLNQIVGDRRVARQGARVAPKPGDLLFEDITEIAHQSGLSGRGHSLGEQRANKFHDCWTVKKRAVWQRSLERRQTAASYGKRRVTIRSSFQTADFGLLLLAR